MDRFVDDEDEIVADGSSVRTPLYLVDAVRFDENHQPYFVRASDGVDLSDHQPGFRCASDAQRAAVDDARQEMIDRAANAWKRDANPPQFTCPECHGTGKDPDGDSDDDECDECGGTGSIRGPNRLSSFQRHDPGKYPDADLRLDRRRSADAQVIDARRAAYDGYVRRLSQAWKHRPARDASEPDNSSPPEVMRKFLQGGDEPDHDIDAVMRRHQRQRDDAWARYRDDLQNAWQRGRNTDPKEADWIMRQGERWRGGR
jgi:hypothetical protein